MRQDVGWHFRQKTRMTHVHIGHVMFGDQLIFRRPFVKRLALRYRTIVCPVCNLRVLWPNSRALSRIMYCGHSTQYSHLVFTLLYVWPPFKFSISQTSIEMPCTLLFAYYHWDNKTIYNYIYCIQLLKTNRNALWWPGNEMEFADVSLTLRRWPSRHFPAGGDDFVQTVCSR